MVKDEEPEKLLVQTIIEMKDEVSSITNLEMEKDGGIIFCTIGNEKEVLRVHTNKGLIIIAYGKIHEQHVTFPLSDMCFFHLACFIRTYFNYDLTVQAINSICSRTIYRANNGVKVPSSYGNMILREHDTILRLEKRAEEIVNNIIGVKYGYIPKQEI